MRFFCFLTLLNKPANITIGKDQITVVPIEMMGFSFDEKSVFPARDYNRLETLFIAGSRGVMRRTGVTLRSKTCEDVYFDAPRKDRFCLTSRPELDEFAHCLGALLKIKAVEDSASDP